MSSSTMDILKNESLRNETQDILQKLHYYFINAVTFETLFNIISKLLHHNCIKYNTKVNILEQTGVNTVFKADQLFDIVMKSDFRVMDIFLKEIEELLPHVYRYVDQSCSTVFFYFKIQFF
jgi:hypothetical protein